MHTQFNPFLTDLYIPGNATQAGRQLDIARNLQDRLIPTPLPPTGGIECFAHCDRNRSDGVFFDLFQPQRDEMAAVIGDVNSGGIAGSILITGIQASLRCMVRQGVDLRDAVTEINRILWELAPDAVQGTLLSARVNPSAHMLRYINAGHHPAIVIRRDHSIQHLEPNAAPLALSRNSPYRELRIRFDPGDIFITASDDIDCEEVCRIAAEGYAPRLREWPTRIGEEQQHTAARIVIVVSYTDSDSSYVRRRTRVPRAPLVAQAAA